MYAALRPHEQMRKDRIFFYLRQPRVSRDDLPPPVDSSVSLRHQSTHWHLEFIFIILMYRQNEKKIHRLSFTIFVYAWAYALGTKYINLNILMTLPLIFFFTGSQRQTERWNPVALRPAAETEAFHPRFGPHLPDLRGCCRWISHDQRCEYNKHGANCMYVYRALYL